jgi:hypothetical protein
MSRWILDALSVSSAALVVGGVVAMVTTSNPSGAIASGITGGIGTAVTGRRRDRQLQQDLHQKILAQVRQETEHIITTQTTPTQDKAEWQGVLREISSKFQSNDAKLENQKERIRTLEAKIRQLNHDLSVGAIAGDGADGADEGTEAISLAPSEHTPSTSLKNSQDLSQVDHVLAYLQSHQVTVADYTPPESSSLEQALDQVAIFLGNNYTSLAALHSQLRRNSRGNAFRFYLQNRTQKDIQINTSFSAMLQRHGCIAKRFYDKTTKILSITPHQQRDDLSQFFSGRWFERFIFHTVAGVLQEKKWSFECLLNPMVTFENGDRYELDLFFWVNDQPLWIECKAGSGFDQYLSQYSRQREFLGVPKSSALLVVLNLPDNLAVTRTEMWGVTVLNHETLVQYLQLDWTPTGNMQESQTPTSTGAAAILSNVKLHPVAKTRRPVMEGLVQLFHAAGEPITLKQAKMTLAENLESMSKNKIQEVLMAMKFVNFFLDQQGNPVKSPTDPVADLITKDVDELERLFVEHYTSEVLKLAPDFFENPQNCLRFEQTVGASVPSLEVLERLRRG